MTDSTALTARESRAPASTGITISAMQIQDMDQAYRLAKAMAQSGMVPMVYNGNAEACFVGILAGAEVGLAPMQSLQSIAVINGNPSIWGDGALALVQASGLLDDIEETDDGTTATCRLVRKGRATPIIRTFSMDDAKKAGLSGKQGPWQNYPARMRQMRARSWAMRDGFADVLKGLHIAEEVRDHPEMAADQPQTQRLSSEMLAEQAGETVENKTGPDPEPTEDTERDEGSASEPEKVKEKPEVSAPSPDQAQAAQETLNDIDGPLEQEAEEQGAAEAEDGIEDAAKAKAAQIVEAIDKCQTIVDLRALHDREKSHIEAMPDEVGERVTRQFNTMREALKRRAKA